MKNILLALLLMASAVVSMRAQSVSVSTSIAGSPFCAGAAVTVNFTTSGTFNGSNIFTAQLSDATGSFASPTVIGTIARTTSGTINARFPYTQVSGTGYRIRVISSSPITPPTGNNGSDLIVKALSITAPTFTPTQFCQGQTFGVSYTAACNFNNSPSNNVFYAVLSGPTGTWSDSTIIGSITTAGSGTINATIPAAQVQGSGYRVRVVASNPALRSNDNGTNLTVTAPVGDPTIFGSNAWNVYAYAGSAFTSYSGYYTETNFSFNSQNRWASGNSPSAADNSSGQAYQGCFITYTSQYSFIYKRRGFTCGYYQLDVPSHDDNVTILIDGVQAYQHIGCCDGHTNVWTGFLGPNTTIEARLQNNGGGAGYLALTFTAAAVPLTTSAPVTVCSGTSTTLTASSTQTLTYGWTPTATVSPTTGSSVTATPTATTTYTVTGTHAGTGCTVSGSVLVTVASTPATAMAATLTTICSGVTTTTLTATGANSYTWSPAAGLSATTGNTVTANPTTTTTYTVTGSNNCTTSTASRTITVQNIPAAPPPTTFGSGTWNAFVYNSTDFSNYQGYYTENNLSFNTTTRWNNGSGPSVANTNSGVAYSGCSVGGTNYSIAFRRTGIPCGYYQLDIPNHDDYVTVLIDGAQVFQHNGYGDAHTNVWTGFIGPSNTVEVRLINFGGPGLLQFTMATSPTSPVTANTPITLCAGSSTTLTATSIIAGATFKWTNGNASNNGTIATPNNASTTVTPNVSDTYTVTMTDAAGTNCTATYAVPITIQPNAATVVSPTSASTYCPGSPFTLTASGASTYTWSASTGAAGGLSATTGFQVTASPTVNTTYTVTGTNNCNTKDATATITITPLPAITTFPTGTWNVYGFNSQTVGTNYYGYYTDNGSGTSGYDFNTTTRWTSGTSPSTANTSNGNAFLGCTMDPTNISLSYKRTGFTCGMYTINVTSHDDAFTMFVNGAQVARHVGNGDNHSPIWTGTLNSTSQVEFQLQQGTGASYLSVTFVAATTTASLSTWIGGTSTDWFTASNWCGSGVPTSTIDVLIPAAGPQNFPVIDGNGAVCRNITINPAVAAGTYTNPIGAATLVTNGSFNLDVYGSWVNNGGFTANSGRVRFVGTNTGSTISSLLPQTFYDLTINKSNHITISSGVQQVANQLALANGIVYQNGVLDILQNATVSSAGNASYVEGDIRKTGNTAFSFPVGKGGRYRPIAISAPAQATDHFTAQYYNTSALPSYPNAQRDATLDHVGNAEYWILNRTGGTSNVNVTLTWGTNSGGVTYRNDLRVARWDINIGRWKDHGNGGTTGNSTSGTIISSAPVTSFSPFTLASSSGISNPLPVELASFSCDVTDTYKVVLLWATASEYNSNYFVVERSQDGISFQALAQLPAAKNSVVAVDYTYTDSLPLPGNSYYRLKQVDQDGTARYLRVCFSENVKPPLHIYPNPADEFVRIEATEDISSIVLRSELGYAFNPPVTHDHGVFVVNTASLASGVYLLEVRQGIKITPIKVVVAH
jgi:hypothetical protein